MFITTLHWIPMVLEIGYIELQGSLISTTFQTFDQKLYESRWNTAVIRMQACVDNY